MYIVSILTGYNPRNHIGAPLNFNVTAFKVLVINLPHSSCRLCLLIFDVPLSDSILILVLISPAGAPLNRLFTLEIVDVAIFHGGLPFDNLLTFLINSFT